MNARPHPGLLPQEKENRPPVFGEADAPGCRAVFLAKEKKTAVATTMNELSKRVNAVPSPGGEGQDEGGQKHHLSVSRARALRKKETWAEKLMWSWLRARRFSQYKFRRQHPEGIYYLDFFCEEASLAVELDGSGHGHPDQQLHDAARTAFLTSQGIKVLRFWNSHLRRNAQSIRDTIFRELQERAPHPLPDYTRPMQLAGKRGEN
jgi:very-short-patch-repair endonuclease